YLDEWMDMRKDRNMHFHFIGDRSAFSPKIRKMMEKVEEQSKIYPNQLNLALNYGSRDELCRAFNRLIQQGKTEITPEDISANLYTAGQPDVDLIIRTGGEMRLSNFLLYQSAYAEFYFTDKLWPDIKKEDINDAICYFNRRERRFGGVIERK
ncbi:MAG: di-trans,poly-cis-decaprenylcistransferase, partial [Clostridia bacterium]|nr:di-trans,poly-cis-decaprenylcistransferase [Clostridia bacterium]